MIENATTAYLASLGMDKHRIEDYNISGTDIVLPCYSMDTFINTSEGSNIYAACLLSGDMEPYDKAKAEWNRKRAEEVA